MCNCRNFILNRKRKEKLEKTKFERGVPPALLENTLIRDIRTLKVNVVQIKHRSILRYGKAVMVKTKHQ